MNIIKKHEVLEIEQLLEKFDYNPSNTKTILIRT